MEGKRRLPSWMIGASTADKVSKSVDVDITKEDVSVVTECTKPEPKGRTRKHKNETSFLVKCETKRKKKGFFEKDVTKCDENVEKVVQKRKRGGVRRKVEESDPPRKNEENNDEFESHDDNLEKVVQKRKRGRVGRKVEESDPLRKNKEKDYEFEENQALSCDEDNGDLTMDDMLSIAKEFVKNDSYSSQQKPLIVPQDTRSLIHEERPSDHNSIENLTSNVILADSSMTDDPAQDMLDLFLGPLLKKPIRKEEANSTVNNIMLPNEVKNQQDDIISSKPVTLTMTKKKSSLRDAVAMLLD